MSEYVFWTLDMLKMFLWMFWVTRHPKKKLGTKYQKLLFRFLKLFSSFFSIFSIGSIPLLLAHPLAASTLGSIFRRERLVVSCYEVYGCSPGVPRHQETMIDASRQQFDAPYTSEQQRGSRYRLKMLPPADLRGGGSPNLSRP